MKGRSSGIEWFLFKESGPGGFIYSSTECATLHLCDGRSCLIIQLRHLDSIPISLLNFLRLPDYTFVGVGIKKNLAKLEKRYWIGCKNAAELGPLAAQVKKRPLLSVSGVDELVSSVVGRSFNLGSYRPSSDVVFKDWGQHDLNENQAKFATVNVYSYYMIGRELFRG
ncbi:Ribonuclease H-like superfamily [Sesbania bispinosa]|nr:Ribonuclease H-like superfamily [Sesbania bispinosa]